MKKILTICGIVASLAILFYGFFFGKYGALMQRSLERSLSELPAVKDGRPMPLSSASADILRFINGKSSVKIDGKYASSSEWLLYINAFPQDAAKDKFFKTDNRELSNLLGADGRYYSYADFEKKYAEIYKAASSEENTTFTQACRLALEKAGVFENALNSMAFYFQGESPRKTFEDWIDLGKAASAELSKSGTASQNSETLRNMYEQLKLFKELKEREDFFGNPKLIPTSTERWLTPLDLLLSPKLDGKNREVFSQYGDLVSNFSQGKSAAEDVDSLYKTLSPSFRIKFENAFNHLDLFYRGAILYLASFIVFLVAVILDKRVFVRLAIPMLCAAFLAQGVGIVARMFIQMRPPVTNLYSSVIFAGWAAVGLGIFLCAKYRKKLYAIAAAPIGFLSIVLALNLPYSGDTMGMMRAVLNSNFWLSVHIVPMMLGYCGVFLAGLVASCKLVSNAARLGKFSRISVLETANTVYAILCFGMVFSFAGTMLGGVWADMSWGRFWGWDPKENGALMVVLWCAFVVHMKVLKIAGPRAILALACIGNIVAAWAWFGVNMMGVGLHSYGFMDSGKMWLALFCAVQLAISLLAFVKSTNKAGD